MSSNDKDWTNTFVCGCGLRIVDDPMGLHSHMQECTTMSQQYAQIYQALGQQKNKMSPENKQYTKNILYLINMFTENILEAYPTMKQQGIQPIPQINVQIPASVESVQQPQSSFNEPSQIEKSAFDVDMENENQQQQQQEEFKNEGSSIINTVPDLQKNMSNDLDLIRQQEQMFEALQRRNNVPSCGYCKKPMQNDQQTTVIQSTECWHQVHLQCFKKECLQKQCAQQAVNCPDCGKEVIGQELRMHLTEQQIGVIEESQLSNLISKDNSIIQCPKCDRVSSVQAGEVNYQAKDEQGQTISRQAAEHMSQHRVRCPCEVNFCKLCQVTPYHIGKTCEQFQSHAVAVKCRVCDKVLNPMLQKKGIPEAYKNVCPDKECQETLKDACAKMLPCGHACGGFKDENKCLPCLNEECVKNMDQVNNGVVPFEDSSAYCTICYTAGLGAMPCVQLGCGHVFHLECISRILQTKWVSPRIHFGFMNCPSCKQKITAAHCPQLQISIQPVLQIEAQIIKMAVVRAKHEGLDKNPRLKDPNDDFFGKLEAFALFKMSYFTCFKCKKPYFGGMMDCVAGQQQAVEFKEDELFCAKCSAIEGQGMADCKIHGTDFIDFKCRYCCSISLWFCFGTTHFCDPCHRKLDYKSKVCKGAETCPLRIQHPKNGDEYALGCSLCRGREQKDF